MGKPSKLLHPTPSEDDIHLTFIQFAKTQPWFKYLLHIPNEFPFNALPQKIKWGYLRKRQMRGAQKGAPDLFLAYPNRNYHGLWIELKRPKQFLRPEQDAFLKLQEQNGYDTWWGSNINELIAYVLNYIRNQGKTMSYAEEKQKIEKIVERMKFTNVKHLAVNADEFKALVKKDGHVRKIQDVLINFL